MSASSLSKRPSLAHTWWTIKFQQINHNSVRFIPTCMVHRRARNGSGVSKTNSVQNDRKVNGIIVNYKLYYGNFTLVQKSLKNNTVHFAVYPLLGEAF